MKMESNVSSDATPFTTTEPTNEKVPSPPEKKEKKKKYVSDTSSSDSDSDDTSRRRNGKPIFRGRVANIINIDKAKDVHIGNRYIYSKTLTYQTKNTFSETDCGTANFPSQQGNGPKPPEELLNSKREINEDDMYMVAENIGRHWKKLARFLPPRIVFSDGQLKTFEDNNPHNQEEVVYEMLKTWKQKYPENATLGILANTLWNIGKGEISQKFKL